MDRKHLAARLSAGQRGAVTVITAPAGSGKTALLRSWVSGRSRDLRVAWVSAGPGERFWRDVIDELSAASGRKLGDVPDDLASLDVPVVLIIDDLHELTSCEALDRLAFLLAHRPPALSVVLATRQDPRLGLHRLRLAGELTELRAADLRFSLDETRELLAGSGLSEAGLKLLHERTEGWVAGLRLATIALSGCPDPEKFVAEFSGSERTVADYLVAEVLDRQPEAVRRLLLRTSVLERVSGPLADALTGCAGSELVLQRLEAANAFVAPIDVGRSWYRYHPLFADLLRLELRRSAPAEVPHLHRTAAAWFAGQGLVLDAVAHAQAAGDWRWAVTLLADNLVTLALDGRIAAVIPLLAKFPAGAETTDAELAVIHAAVELARGAPGRAAEHLGNAARLAAMVPAERRTRFETMLAGREVALARYRGELGHALDASRSLDAALRTPPAQPVAAGDDARALALMHLGAIESWACRRDDATRHLEEALRLARLARRPYIEIGALGHLAAAALGESATRARRLSEEAIELAGRHGWGATHAMAVLGAALVWSGRFAEAESWLDRADDRDPLTGLLREEARGLMFAAQGRFGEALKTFEAIPADEIHAERIGDRVLQMRARLGKVCPEGPPREDGKAHTWIGADIEETLLRAVAQDRLGDAPAAEKAIERALDLAEPSGLLLPFAMQPVHALLEHHPRHRTAHATLLTEILDMLAGSEPKAYGTEELSDAELRVLRYLPSNLGAPEIAAQLYVSANTVKTHMRHIYTKLGAHRRTEAVHRARQLGLLAG